MPGQGYHYGQAKLIADREGRKFTKEMRIGVLLVDALNSASGSRRNSHFTGGAGCLFPKYSELRQTSNIQSWDSGYRKSFLVDPKINMRLFEATNIHITEGDYKDGIRIHLLGDSVYDHLIQQKIFDVSRQNEDVIVERLTGEKMDGATFRKEIYEAYPMLDQYLLNLAGVTVEEIEETKRLLFSTLNDEMATFVTKYLNFNSEYVWRDTHFFKKEDIDRLIDDTLYKVHTYLSR